MTYSAARLEVVLADPYPHERRVPSGPATPCPACIPAGSGLVCGDQCLFCEGTGSVSERDAYLWAYEARLWGVASSSLAAAEVTP